MIKCENECIRDIIEGGDWSQHVQIYRRAYDSNYKYLEYDGPLGAIPHGELIMAPDFYEVNSSAILVFYYSCSLPYSGEPDGTGGYRYPRYCTRNK